MSDHELLEKAAKAAGLAVIIPAAHQRGLWIEGLEDEWNPITDDGDALRLAVKLQLQVTVGRMGVQVSKLGFPDIVDHDIDDPYAATRRAIVRAAAELGEQHGN